jgi:N utilization substance protein A
MVVNELRGEKVDIVPYSDDASEFVMKALAPARVREVRIHPDTGTAEVIVPDFQLSLAIGKEGQNARLAARLTGWRVDIKSESQLAEEESGGGVEYAEGEWVTNDSGELVWQPAEGGEAISAAEAGYAAPVPPSGEGEAAEGDAPAAVGDAPAADGDGAATADGDGAAPVDAPAEDAPTDVPTEGESGEATPTPVAAESTEGADG